MPRRPKFHKPAIGTDYKRHHNLGGEWCFRGGKKSDPKTYTVTMTPQGFTCDCPGFTFRGKCKHVISIGENVDRIVS